MLALFAESRQDTHHFFAGQEEGVDFLEALGEFFAFLFETEELGVAEC